MATLLEQIAGIYNLSLKYTKDGVLNLSPVNTKLLVNIKNPNITFDSPLTAWEAKANPLDFETKTVVSYPAKELAIALTGKEVLTTGDITTIEQLLELAKKIQAQAPVVKGKTPYQELTGKLTQDVNNWRRNKTFPYALSLIERVYDRAKQLRTTITTEETEKLQVISEIIRNHKELDKTNSISIEEIEKQLLEIRPDLPLTPAPIQTPT